ncbi:MAG: hypothetical protein NZ585_14875, partial [Chloracidobacterium sp.]|nr:hypothetical protein [Chloracidobacterium sp.]
MLEQLRQTTVVIRTKSKVWDTARQLVIISVLDLLAVTNHGMRRRLACTPAGLWCESRMKIGSVIWR